VSRKAKEKIKPQWMRWYEDSFQADLRVRYMKPTQRHFYRALIIQSFYCGTRPYLPDNDDLLWMLADANDKEHWMEHREVVRGMFIPVVIDEQPLLSHGKILREWKNTEAMYSGKAGERQGVKQGTHGSPKGTRSRAKVGDNRSEEQTGTDLNRPDPSLPDMTLPESRRPERSEGDSKLTDRQTNRSQSTTTTSDSDSGSGAGASQSVSQSLSYPSTQKETSQGAGAGQKPLGLGTVPAQIREGSGKPVTAKVQTFAEEEEGFVTQGVTSATLLARYWAIAEKKEFMGKQPLTPAERKDALGWMEACVRMHGVEKVKLCLDHVARSDFWGAQEKGKINGVAGFQRALEAIYKQADAYTTKVKESKLTRTAGL
jgi:hypothetical protein